MCVKKHKNFALSIVHSVLPQFHSHLCTLQQNSIQSCSSRVYAFQTLSSCSHGDNLFLQCFTTTPTSITTSPNKPLLLFTLFATASTKNGPFITLRSWGGSSVCFQPCGFLLRLPLLGHLTIVPLVYLFLLTLLLDPFVFLFLLCRFLLPMDRLNTGLFILFPKFLFFVHWVLILLNNLRNLMCVVF